MKDFDKDYQNQTKDKTITFASEHDVLGIRAAGEGTGEHLYMAI